MKIKFDCQSATARWGNNFSHFVSLDHFLESNLRLGVQAIDIGAATLFLYYRPNKSKTLVVHLSGAMVRAPDRHLPYLAGLDLTSDLDCSFLAVDDPALQYDDELALGWHIGTRDFSLQEILPQVFKHVANQTGSEKTVLTGGSGGGYASLVYGSLIPSTVVAFNPQTAIAKYSPAAYRRYASACWSLDEQGAPVIDGGAITDLTKHFRTHAYPKGVYLQNIPDWHTNVHAIPLKVALGGSATIANEKVGGLSFVFDSWGDGHAPLPKAVYKRIVDAAIHGDDLGDIAGRLCAELAGH